MVFIMVSEKVAGQKSPKVIGCLRVGMVLVVRLPAVRQVSTEIKQL